MTLKPTYEELQRKVKESEAALRQSEYRIKQYFAMAGVMFVALDAEGRITLINECGLETLGYQREELLGKDWFKTCLPHEVQKDVSAVYHQLMQGDVEPVEYYENPVLRKDGAERIIAWHNTLLKDSGGKTAGVLSSGEDITARKRAEQALTESEKKYRTILETIEDSYLEVDLEGNFQFFNHSFCNMLGCPADELLGKNNREFMDKANAEKVFQIFYEVYETKKPVSGASWEFLRKDGTRRHVEASVSLIVDDQGEPIGFQGLGRDVTEYLLIEKKLQQSLKTTEKIIDNLPIGMMMVGKDKKIRRINRRALQIIGFDSEKELVGKICHANVCPAQTGKCPITDLGKTLDRSEKIVVHQDGRHIPILKTALPITINDEAVVLEAFMDITELKAAEKALSDKEKKHRAIMDTCADPFVVYDNKGRVTYLNPAFTEIFGWTSAELLGERIDFVPDDALPETQKAIKAVFAGENLTWFESRRFTKEGRIIDVRIGAAMLRDENGTPEGIVVNLQDISAQKRIMAELESARIEAESASHAKSEFLANMSHEIRTPMNGIIGMTELVLGSDLTPEQREYLSMAKMSADSLLALINDILDFSKIEAGKLELEEIDFNLRNTLENAADTLALKAHEKGLELACHIRPDVPTALVGDPGRLRQIIVNLAGNSLKFTEQGEVVIRVEVEAESDDAVQLHFMVADTGIGIPQERLASIFESFEQVDGSTTRKYGGTGLGLSISRQLVEFMGGKIWVESPAYCQFEEQRATRNQQRVTRNQQPATSNQQPIPQSEGGPGSIFHFTAHFEHGNLEKRGTPRLEYRDLSGLPVLIVDDNYTNRMLLLEMLTAWGLVPTAAAEGPEALGLSEQAFTAGKPFRLVLMDMQMPELDGFDVARRIKVAPWGADVKIIMLSSMGKRGDSAQCKAAGVSGYLPKPVKQSDLLDAIMMTMGLAVEAEPTVITRHTVYEARERLSILLAEDNVINQTLAIRLLETRGHRVSLATNGKEAVAAFKKGNFDLILMDVQMPEMDGYEATGHIRQWEQRATSNQQRATSNQQRATSNEQRATSNQQRATSNQQPAPRIPIVAMTAHAMQGDREKCLASGMDDYVSKPIKPQVLFDVIRKRTHELKEKKAAQQAPGLKAAQPLSPEAFDLEKTMETVLGDRGLFQEIAAVFLEELPGHLASIRAGIADRDAEALNRAAHSLKGSAGNFGADQAYAAAYHLEKLGKNGELDKSADGLAKLEEALSVLAAEMKTVLQEMTHEDSDRRR